jgi:glutamine phosphoribosylpyrophosphate amidotransferase
MIGFTDRIRLRPLTVGVKDSMLYLSSEESAIRLVCPDLDRAWIPMGGEPIVGSLERPLQAREAVTVGESSGNKLKANEDVN